MDSVRVERKMMGSTGVARADMSGVEGLEVYLLIQSQSILQFFHKKKGFRLFFFFFFFSFFPCILLLLF
jgi:hypothetical protein